MVGRIPGMQASQAATQHLSLLQSIIPTSQHLHGEMKNNLLITTLGAADWEPGCWSSFFPAPHPHEARHAAPWLLLVPTGPPPPHISTCAISKGPRPRTPDWYGRDEVLFRVFSCQAFSSSLGTPGPRAEGFSPSPGSQTALDFESKDLK